MGQNKIWLIGVLLCGLFPFCGIRAQQLTLTLGEVIQLAQKQSPYYHLARHNYERSYWRYANFRTSFLPQIRLNATIPTFYREIYPVTQPDGSILFRKVSQANNSLGVNIVQSIGFTGGKLIIGSRLQRTDNFQAAGSSFFLSTPFSFSYQQNSMLYNELAWQRKIEPLLFETADKTFSEEMEIAALEAAKLFFEALSTHTDEQIAHSNLAYSDTLYLLSKERFLLGTVSKGDLLQLELNTLKAQNSYTESRIRKEAASRNLKRILGIPLEEGLDFTPPDPPSALVAIDFERALDEAQTNRPAVLRFRTQRLEAEQQIARAKGQNSLNFSLMANLGTQQTAPNLTDAYRNLQNQQYIGIALDMPLQDWGYRKSQIRLSKANRELVEVNVQQEELGFEQEIYLQVMQFNQQYNQYTLAQKADTIASERLAITRERYLLGKASVTDLNLALTERISATEAKIQALKNYWLAYYTVRRLTLYDFINRTPLQYRRM